MACIIYNFCLLLKLLKVLNFPLSMQSLKYFSLFLLQVCWDESLLSNTEHQDYSLFYGSQKQNKKITKNKSQKKKRKKNPQKQTPNKQQTNPKNCKKLKGHYDDDFETYDHVTLQVTPRKQRLKSTFSPSTLPA